MSFVVRASRNFEWLGKRLGEFTFSAKAKAIEAADESGRIVGMVGYDWLTQNSAQIHIALDVPMAWRALARPTFKYPFEELGRGVLIATVASQNWKSLRLTRHVGFKETHRIRDAVSKGVDFVIFEMRREECRWLED